MRARAGSAATPAARCRKFRRGSFMPFLRRLIGSIQAYAARLDRARPSLDLASEEFPQIVRGPPLRSDDGHADLLQLGLHCRGVDGRDECIVELRDDRRRRAFGHEDTVPVSGLEIGEALLM